MFDPYHKWLGIQPDQRPPTLYQLLGISPREQDPEVIEEAAIRQTAHVRTYQTGPHAQECARVLGEIARARATLVDPAKRIDDLRLAQSAAQRSAGPATRAVLAEPAPASAAGPSGPGPDEFQFLDSPASSASSSGELPLAAIVGSIPPSLARKRPKTAPWVKKLQFMVAIALGGLVPLTGLLIFWAVNPSKPNPAPTSPSHVAKGGEPAQPNSPSKPSPRAASPKPSTPRPAPQPRAEPPKEETPDPPPPTRPAPNRKVKPRSVPSEVASPPAKKLPVPDEAKQATAEKQIKESFQKDYLAAKKTAADKRALAAKLMQEAKKTSDDPVARFVLLREARDLAALAGNVATALAATEETIREYEVEPLVLKRTVLTTVSKVVVTASAHKELVEAILLVVNEALTQDQFESAAQLLALAEAAVRKAQSPSLLGQVQACAKQMAELKKEAEAVQAAEETLRDKPDDPPANLVKGKYLCFRRGQWEKGLPFLVRGGDMPLQELAKKDLANPSEASAQTELGDQWWDLAEAQRGTAEMLLKGRAEYWYQQALPRLTGFTQTRVEKRLKEYAEKAPAHKPAVVAGELRRFTGHKDRVTGVAVTADGSRAVSGSADGIVIMWDTETVKELQRFTNHQGEVTCVAMTSDGNRIISGGKDGKVLFHNVESGRTSNVYSGSRPIQSLTISPDGGIAIIGSTTGTIWLWPLEGGQILRWDWKGGVAHSSVAVSPNGRLILAAGSDASVRLWDFDNRREVGHLPVPLPDVRGLAFTPDGLQVATGGADRLIRFWDATSGKASRVFKGHTQRVTSLALSSDGRRLLSGSDDKTVRLWDVKTGGKLRCFTDHTDKVTSVAISADGRLGLSGSDDKTVRIWKLP